LLAQLRRRIPKRGVSVQGTLGLAKAFTVDVGADNRDAVETGFTAGRDRVAMQQDCNRVGLFAGGAPGAPDAKFGVAAIPQLRDHSLLDHRIRRPVPEELGDVDGEHALQPVVLLRIGVQNARIITVGKRGVSAHANGDAAAQAFVLVARTTKSPITGDLVHQGAELRVGGVGHARLRQERLAD
jgi:hypothetical protein